MQLGSGSYWFWQKDWCLWTGCWLRSTGGRTLAVIPATQHLILGFIVWLTTPTPGRPPSAALLPQRLPLSCFTGVQRLILLCICAPGSIGWGKRWNLTTYNIGPATLASIPTTGLNMG